MSYDKKVPFSFKKKGIYYFERRIPRDLENHYLCRKVSFSLRTRSSSVASARSLRAAHQLEHCWYHLRLEREDLPGKHLLKAAVKQVGVKGISTREKGSKAPSVSLSEAVEMYLRLKGSNRPKTFKAAAERSCGYVIEVAGNKDLKQYTRTDANRLRDCLLERNMAGSSITRNLGTVRAIFNLANSELDLDLRNPFSNIYYDRSSGVQERAPFSQKDIETIQKLCIQIDDELRWLVALISDTGMRLAEAAGLLISDLKIDHPIPHVVIREYQWRRLKTAGSAREVPLTGASLWAAHQLVNDMTDCTFAFPRYNKQETTNSNSASAALNKWLKGVIASSGTVHSFRHSLRDRLRSAECPPDIVDQIGGWTCAGVGQSYGKGYPLEVMERWMTRAVAMRSS